VTSGRLETAAPNLAALASRRRNGRWSHRDQMKNAKPDPDPLDAAAERLGAPIKTAAVVGDSI
jgi:beta-phosphoglucomutase-like phosphatase (HAD superfamily)